MQDPRVLELIAQFFFGWINNELIARGVKDQITDRGKSPQITGLDLTCIKLTGLARTEKRNLEQLWFAHAALCIKCREAILNLRKPR